MRIIYVLPKANFFSEGMRGRVSHALGVVRGLGANGIDVTVVSGPGLREFLPDERTVEVATTTSRRWLEDLKTAIGRELDRHDEPTTVIVRYAVSNAFRIVGLMRERRDRVSWCFEVNSLAFHQLSRLPTPLRKLILAVERRIVGAADSRYLISERIRRDLSPREATPRDIVVPNGGPAPIELPSRQGHRAYRFVFFGIYQSYYNIEILLRGFRAARQRGLDAELHFFGAGAQQARIRSAANTHDDVFEHGRYRIEELTSTELAVDDCTLLLPFASVRENDIRSPIKLYEYMATGLPIIASRTRQILTTLEHARTGWLVDADDPGEWCDAMLRLHSDAELRRSLSAAMQAIYPEHTWPRRMARLYAALESNRQGDTRR